MRILAVDDLHPIFEDSLRSAGHFVEYDLELNSKAALIKKIQNFNVLAIRSKFFIDKEIVDVMPEGFIIARAGAGMDNIDEEYCKIKGIKLVNAPEGNRDAVAEHIIGMLLTSYRNIIKSNAEIRSKIWEREGNRGLELKGKTIGIIGFGNMGSTLAKKLSSFEMNILAYDKYLSIENVSYVKQVSLKEVMSESDIISINVPLTSETSHFINSDFFKTLGKPAFIINTSRGKVIKTSDLVEAINSGKILGAALDVLENERINHLDVNELEWYNYLVKSDKVVLTSHIAGWTIESYRRISEVLVQKLLQSQV